MYVCWLVCKMTTFNISLIKKLSIFLLCIIVCVGCDSNGGGLRGTGGTEIRVASGNVFFNNLPLGDVLISDGESITTTDPNGFFALDTSLILVKLDLIYEAQKASVEFEFKEEASFAQLEISTRLEDGIFKAEITEINFDLVLDSNGELTSQDDSVNADTPVIPDFEPKSPKEHSVGSKGGSAVSITGESSNEEDQSTDLGSSASSFGVSKPAR